MLNNIVGLKPSVGLVSTSGVVPACRTLDCVSVFSLTVDDAMTALAAMAGPDGSDPYSRDRRLGGLSRVSGPISLGVPYRGQLRFFGDQAAAAAYDDALERWARLGARLVEVDFEPFYETARLLYQGPWLAERYLVIRDLLASAPDALHPTTREIIQPGARLSAAAAFAAFYRLEELRAASRRVLAGIDALALPTAPTAYTVDQVLADPIELNSRLGTYTNFVNLLDLCGLALPATMLPEGVPFGITLLAPGGRDADLANLGRLFHADTQLTMGALGLAQPPLAPIAADAASGEIALAVVGAHLSGMPLNHELTSRGGRLVCATTTAPDYKLYALDGTVPPKPGLLRTASGGSAIELEIWSLSVEAFGSFVAGVPGPLSIGTIKLIDGSTVKGFLVEALATDRARDISEFGGWRTFTKANASA